MQKDFYQPKGRRERHVRSRPTCTYASTVMAMLTSKVGALASAGDREVDAVVNW